MTHRWLAPWQRGAKRTPLPPLELPLNSILVIVVLGPPSWMPPRSMLATLLRTRVTR
jgi:hypothetical protein